MIDKQQEAIIWLQKLQQLVNREQLPARIKDSISECEAKVKNAEPDWSLFQSEVNEVLESIKGKLVKETPLEIRVHEDKVTIEEIKTFVRNTTERAHTDNLSSIEAIEHRKNIIVRECYQKINEIACVEANMEFVENEGRYIQFFENIKNDYNRKMLHLLKELIEDIGSNTGHMMKYIKNMFQSISGIQMGISNKKYYTEYEEKKEIMDDRFLKQVENGELGGSPIVDFGFETKNKVKKLVSKAQKKKRFLTLLPVILVIAYLFLSRVFPVVEKYIEYQTAKVESTKAATESKNGEMIENVVSGVVNGVDTIKANRVAESAKAVGGINVWTIIIIVGVIFIAYRAYIKMLTRQYNDQVSKTCGEYLRGELLRFEENCRINAGAHIERIVADYEQQYLNTLNEIFKESDLDTTAEDETNRELDKIIQEWNHIKQNLNGE